MMADVDLYRCGYCGSVLNSEDLVEHECYKNVDARYNYLVRDENDIVTIAQNDNEELKSGRESSPKPPPLDDNALNEMIINAVSKRRPLYDHRIPLSDRTTLKKNALWMEVVNAVNGQLAVEDIKEKWKYLRDAYIKAKKNVKKYVPSGSGSQGPIKNISRFKFYDVMAFLDDIYTQKETLSSVDGMFAKRAKTVSCSSTSGLGTETSISLSASPAPSSVDSCRTDSPAPPPVVRKKAGKGTDGYAAELLKFMREPIHVQDEVDGFLLRLGAGLRRLPYKTRTDVEIELLTLVRNAENGEHT